MAIIFTVASQEAAQRRTKDKLCGRHSKKEPSRPAIKSNTAGNTSCAESDTAPRDGHGPSPQTFANGNMKGKPTKENE